MHSAPASSPECNEISPTLDGQEIDLFPEGKMVENFAISGNRVIAGWYHAGRWLRKARLVFFSMPDNEEHMRLKEYQTQQNVGMWTYPCSMVKSQKGDLIPLDKVFWLPFLKQTNVNVTFIKFSDNEFKYGEERVPEEVWANGVRVEFAGVFKDLDGDEGYDMTFSVGEQTAVYRLADQSQQRLWSSVRTLGDPLLWRTEILQELRSI